MKDFSRGVSYYTFGRVDIGFPEDDLACQWCPLMGVESRTDRLICRKTGEYLVNPKFSVGTNCPIRFGVEAEEEAEPKDDFKGDDFSWGSPLPF
jgi:hypothetical protein